MSPKAKNKSFPPVKVTEEFLEETKRLAEIADEYLSDYIRKAVKTRNEMEKKAVVDEHKNLVDSTHKNNTVSKCPICNYEALFKTDQNSFTYDCKCKATLIYKNGETSIMARNGSKDFADVMQPKLTIESVVEKAMSKIDFGQPKSTMVKPLVKGGGKK
jgi:hypothetical protein